MSELRLTRELTVTGNDRERGLAQGKFFRSIRTDFAKAIRDVPLYPSWIQKRIPLFVYNLIFKKIGKKFFNQHFVLLKNYQGKTLVPWMQGLADGFERDLDYLYGVNAYEILSSQPPCSWGCTSLVFSKNQTVTHEPLLAYNHDFPTSFGNYLFVRKTLPAEGYAHLSLTYPPLFGSIGGVNEKGLALSLNHAFTKELGKTPAILITLLVEHCLTHCADVNEAMDLIVNTPVPNGSMITLVDKTGKRAAVELSHTKKKVRLPLDNQVFHTFNNFQDEEMKEVEIPFTAKGKGPLKGLLLHCHNISRLEHYTKLIDHAHPYTAKEIHSLMSDHNDGEGSCYTICRHHPQAADTLCSALMSPAKGSLKIIFGNPCQQKEYQEYLL